MNISVPPPTNTEDFSGNMIRPFQLESSSLRGRIVRFNSVLDDILQPHGYPDVVSQLLGEMVTLCSMLSSMLKFEGIFTLQTSGDGPVSMLVADMMSSGEIRGCATFHEDRLKDIEDNNFKALLGKGYIAFTVDQGENMERYQGIVELKGDSLLESIQHYFEQSEQIQTAMMLAVRKQEGKWISSGLMLQHMPTDGGHGQEVMTQDVKAKSENVHYLDEEDWQRAKILLESCKEEELLSDDLNSHDILFRLFHEEGVRVFSPTALKHQCRCSADKVKNIYKMLTPEEREDMIKDGKVVMTCEFCSGDYELDLVQINVEINKELEDEA